MELCIHSPIRLHRVHREFSFLFNPTPTHGNAFHVTIKLSKKGLNTENCALLGYYAVSSGNILPTFRDNLSILSSGVKNPKESMLSHYGVYIGKGVTPENGTGSRPGTSVKNFHYSLRNNPEERSSLIYFAAEARNHAQISILSSDRGIL